MKLQQQPLLVHSCAVLPRHATRSLGLSSPGIGHETTALPGLHLGVSGMRPIALSAFSLAVFAVTTDAYDQHKSAVDI